MQTQVVPDSIVIYIQWNCGNVRILHAVDHPLAFCRIGHDPRGPLVVVEKRIVFLDSAERNVSDSAQATVFAVKARRTNIVPTVERNDIVVVENGVVIFFSVVESNGDRLDAPALAFVLEIDSDDGSVIFLAELLDITEVYLRR